MGIWGIMLIFILLCPLYELGMFIFKVSKKHLEKKN